jgi:DNA invertase Pin-like site-specific DNA recombinase
MTADGYFGKPELGLVGERTRDGLARVRVQGKGLGRPPRADPSKTNEILRLRGGGLSLRQMGKRLGIGHQTAKQRL